MNPTTRKNVLVIDGEVAASWLTFMEWPRNGESADAFAERLRQEYRQLAQRTFHIEITCRSDGSPRYAWVDLFDCEV